MSPATVEALRETLARALPELVETAVAHYQELVTMPAPKEDKDRATRQTAAKATLAHIEYLIRISAGFLPATDAPTEAPDDPAGRLLAQARAAIARMEAADDGDAEG